MTYYTLPFYKKDVRFQIADTYQVSTFDESPSLTEQEVNELLNERLNNKDLKEVLKQKAKIVIVIPNLQQHGSVSTLLPSFLKKVMQHKEHQAKVTLLIAGQELQQDCANTVNKLLKKHKLNKCKVVAHRPTMHNTIYLGKANDDIGIYLNQLLFYSDCNILLNTMELNTYTKYSDGWQTVAMNLSADITAQKLEHALYTGQHSAASTQQAQQDAHSLMKQVANLVRYDYAVQVIDSENDTLLDLYCGKADNTIDLASSKAKQLFSHEIERQFDTAIIGMPAHRGCTLYEACQVIIQLVLGGHMPLLPGSPIISPVNLHEQENATKKDKIFLEWMAKSPDKRAKDYAELKDKSCSQIFRAMEMAEVLAKHPVIFVGSKPEKKLAKWGIQYAKTMPAAFKLIKKNNQDPKRILLLQDPLRTMLVLKTSKRNTQRLRKSSGTKVIRKHTKTIKNDVPSKTTTKQNTKRIEQPKKKTEGRKTARPTKATARLTKTTAKKTNATKKIAASKKTNVTEKTVKLNKTTDTKKVDTKATEKTSKPRGRRRRKVANPVYGQARNRRRE